MAARNAERLIDRARDMAALLNQLTAYLVGATDGQLLWDRLLSATVQAVAR
jgi:hypothetical protein